ncbi:MAG: (deoxy)nucleoside triphosphate pyrophosphohydrolase [Fibrobacteria bacterium]
MTKPILQVVAALILEHGTVLMARKKPGKPNAGMWEFPGGKVEAGETYQASLVREIKEELGVKIEAGAVFAETDYEDHERIIRLIGIEASLVEKHFVLADHDEVRMVRIPDLLNYALAPADIPIARLLTERIRLAPD